ncbi:hypothetical protein [uncultured Bifidobacterium sp.]|uniref:hypothetical protein n=1 Tax=uncultured Bifidobacterium sp. TaxID=165187 RepID=UPI002596B386|nr:hypothetical protein [uncultured Bifidobacterium sp.]
MSADNEYLSGVQAYVTLGITIAIGVFALFALLFAVLRKPIAVMVFNVLSLLAFAVQYYDFSDRGVVPSDHFSWGWGMYLYVAAFILTVVCAIVTLIDRRRMDAKADLRIVIRNPSVASSIRRLPHSMVDGARIVDTEMAITASDVTSRVASK